MTLGGPIDEGVWPSRLRGVVAEPGARRIHGYSADGDLARYYSSSAVVLLTLTGELPSDAAARAFEIASIFSAPVPAGEGPAHAAHLTRLMGASASAVIGNAAITLAEEARYWVEKYSALFGWLQQGGPFPAGCAATSEADRAATLSLGARLEEVGFLAPIFRCGVVPAPVAAVLGVYYACGLTDPDRAQTAMVVARLPCAVAEGLSARPGYFKNYPMNTPPYEYSAVSVPERKDE